MMVIRVVCKLLLRNHDKESFEFCNFFDRELLNGYEVNTNFSDLCDDQMIG